MLVAFGGSEQTIPYAEAYLNIVIPGSVLTNLSYSFQRHYAGGRISAKIDVHDFDRRGPQCDSRSDLYLWFRYGDSGRGRGDGDLDVCQCCFRDGALLQPSPSGPFPMELLPPEETDYPEYRLYRMAPFLMNLTASGVNIIMNHQLVRGGGDLAIGAYGIVNSYAILIVMCVMGLCQGMQPIVGYNYGAQKYKRMKDTLLMTIRVAFVIMGVGWLLGELIPNGWSALLRPIRTCWRWRPEGCDWPV